MIRAELADGPEALARVAANLLVWLDQNRQADLVRAFNEWFGRILIRNLAPGIELESIRNLTERHCMLHERSTNWGRAYIEQGLKQRLGADSLEGVLG